jgi:hypothetical protein
MSDLRTRIADEISNIQVGSGYESTTIGITAALEAANALIAAGVVAEEPEWEDGIEYGYLDFEHGLIPLMSGYEGITHERPVRYGPWVPVKQEGAETDG